MTGLAAIAILMRVDSAKTGSAFTTSHQSFALTAGISGELSADALRGVIAYAQHIASAFVECRFQGWFVAEPA